MHYTLSKKIVTKIIKEEAEKSSIPVTILPLSNLENILYTLLIQRKIPNIFTSKNIYSSYNKEQQIIKILLSNIKNDPNLGTTPSFYLLTILRTTYHEYNHKLYYHKMTHTTTLSLAKLIFLIEDLLQEVMPYNMEIYNNSYLEILANLYSNKKTTIFLKKYPNIYQQVSKYLEALTILSKIKYINYDLEPLLQYFTQIYINHPNQFKFINPILKCMYNSNHHWKSLQELAADSIWQSLEKSAQYTILSSKTYLQSLNYTHLNKEELNTLCTAFLCTALQYTLNQELQRKEKNTKLKDKIIKSHLSPYYFILISNQLVEKEEQNTQKIKYLKCQLNILNLLRKNQSNKLIKRRK